MININCFDDTSLEELKTKFYDLTKDVSTDEQKQEIGISLILDKYKQLQRKINTLRKTSNLSPSPIKSVDTLSDIKNKYSTTIESLHAQLSNCEEQLQSLENKSFEQQELANNSKLTKITIGGQSFKVEIAISEEEKEIGLANRHSLDKDKGMLFVFDEPDEVSFWMKDTKIPLDIIFINDDLTVISVFQGEPDSEDLITESNVAFVLEVNQNSGIKSGDELEFVTDSQINKDKMLVLDPNGETQMELDGGERIFSRANTKVLIKFAKKAFASQNDNDYKALGKRVFKFLQVQSENSPEYVKSKN